MEGRSTNVAPNLMVNETDKISILNSEFKRYLNVIRTAPRNLIAGQWTVGWAGHTMSLLNIHPAQPSPAQARVQHKLAISGWWRDHCGQVRRGLSRARSRQHKCMKTVPIMDRLTDCSETLACTSSIHSWSRVLYIYRLLSILAVYKITPLIIIILNFTLYS